jgi:hypothetical protein
LTRLPGLGRSDKRRGVRIRSACLWLALLAVPTGCERAEAPAAEPSPRARAYRSAVVDGALEAAADVVRTRGFTEEGEDWHGFIVQRDTQVREVPLRAGSCYVVMVAGSSALREVSLRLFDSDGGEVARDGHPGPATALHHCPPQSGTHYLGVRAVSGNGLFAVRGFRGPTGLDVRLDDLFPPPTPAPAAKGERP